MTIGKQLLLVLTVGFLLRAGLLAFFWNQPLVIVDENHYNNIAINLYNHDEFSLEFGQPTAIRPPLYPAFLRAVYYITDGVHLNAVRIVQVFISLLIIYMVYAFGRKLFDAKTGLLAALIFAVYPSFLFFTHFILTEVLFTLLLLFFLYCFIELLRDERRHWVGLPGTPSSAGWFRTNRYALYAGIFLGLGALTRSILYPFIAPATAFLLIFGKGSFKAKVTISLVFVIGFVLTLSPWTARNTKLFKQFVPVGTMGGLNLYMGNYEHTPLYRAWDAVDLPYEKAWYRGHKSDLAALNEAEKQKWAVAKSKEFIKANLCLTIKRVFIKAGYFWGLERTVAGGIYRGYWLQKGGKIINIFILSSVLTIYSILIFGSIFGISFTINVSPIRISFLLLLIVYFTSLHALVFGHPRYHLPLIPLLSVFISWSLLNYKILLKRKSSLRFKTSIIICFIMVTNWTFALIYEGVQSFKNVVGY